MLPPDDLPRSAPGVWELPGYEVEALLGFGASGEVWRARERASGELVALKRLRPGAPPDAVRALRREAALLRGLDTPYVVRLRAVLGEASAPVLVLDHAGGGSLASLLLARGRLAPGEVVTVAVPVAEALAAAHASGLVHGDVSPANVLLTEDGMPLLGDLGVARLRADRGPVDGVAEYADPAVLAGAAPGPASDVRALAAVCHHALAGSPPHGGGRVLPPVDQVLAEVADGRRAPLGLLAPEAPRALVEAVEAALHPDPALRPDAAALARALRAAAPAAPVVLVRPDGSPLPGEQVRPTHRVLPPVAGPSPAEPPARRLPRRPLALAAAAVGAVGAAALLGWQLGAEPPPVPATAAGAVPAASAASPSPAPTTPPAAPPASAAAAAAAAAAAPAAPPAPAAAPGATPSPSPGARWAVLLDALDAARARAYAAGDPTLLTGTYAPGSPALLTDTAVLEVLAGQGRTARGLRHRVLAVQELAAGPTWARLRVRDELAAHEVLGPGGVVLERRPARAAALFEVDLVRMPDGWRLREVRPVGG